MNPEQTIFYQTSDAYFNILAQADNNYFKEYLDFVKYYVPLSGKILDAGCGLGQSTYFLAEFGYSVIGLDGADRFIKQARLNFPTQNYVVGDLGHLAFDNNTFFAVATYNTLEHVENITKVLEEMIRILKPGGFLLIHSPNLLSPKHIIDAFFKKQGMTFEGKKNIFQLFFLFIRNVYLISSRRLFNYASFRYRQPNYNFVFPDNDASVFLNPVDIALFLKKQDFKIISYQQVSHLSPRHRLKKIYSIFLADYMGIIRIVAQKKTI